MYFKNFLLRRNRNRIERIINRSRRNEQFQLITDKKKWSSRQILLMNNFIQQHVNYRFTKEKKNLVINERFTQTQMNSRLRTDRYPIFHRQEIK